MLLLTNDDVRKVLTPQICLAALEQSYQEIYDGYGVCRPNINSNIPVGSTNSYFKWSTMEGGSAVTNYFAMRMKCDLWSLEEYEFAPGQRVQTNEWYSTQKGKFCGLIFLVDTRNAEPLAIFHDSVIQRMRVGADGAIGTKNVARADAAVMGILGSGGIARWQLAATALVRGLEEVRVFSPTPEHREQFAREMSERCDLDVRAVSAPEDVYRGADIVAGCADGGFVGEENNALILGRYLEPGTHFTNIGGGGGIDSSAIEKTDFFLRLGTAPAPVGIPEFDIPDAAVMYAVPVDHFSQDRFYCDQNSRRHRRESDSGKTVFLADVLAGRALGRTSDEQITFSERGNLQGAQFHAVAAKAYEAARELGIGRELPTEWFLQDERN